MTDTEIQTLFTLIGDVGDWIIFLFLFVTERRAHDETRDRYEDKLSRMIEDVSRVHNAMTVDQEK